MTLTSPGTVVIAWRAALTGYDLQQNSDLAPTNGQAVTNAPVVVGDDMQVLVPPAMTNHCYPLQAGL